MTHILVHFSQTHPFDTSKWHHSHFEKMITIDQYKIIPGKSKNSISKKCIITTKTKNSWMKIPSDRDCVQLEFSLPALLHPRATQTEEIGRDRKINLK